MQSMQPCVESVLRMRAVDVWCKEQVQLLCHCDFNFGISEFGLVISEVLHTLPHPPTCLY